MRVVERLRAALQLQARLPDGPWQGLGPSSCQKEHQASLWGPAGRRGFGDCQIGVLGGKAGHTELLAPAEVSSAQAASVPPSQGEIPSLTFQKAEGAVEGLAGAVYNQ